MKFLKRFWFEPGSNHGIETTRTFTSFFNCVFIGSLGSIVKKKRSISASSDSLLFGTVTAGQCLQANLIFLWFVSFDQAKEMNKLLLISQYIIGSIISEN